jgi:hypothetical protein
MTAQYRWFPQLWKGVSANRILRLLCLVWKRKTKVMSATSISVVCNLLGLRLRLPAEFSTAHSTKTSLLHHMLHLDPLSDHPKSSIGCIKINCDGWEAMVCIFCQLVAWIMVWK